MLIRPNDYRGTTLILATGDDLDAVPDSHRDLVTAAIRHVFADPIFGLRRRHTGRATLISIRSSLCGCRAEDAGQRVGIAKASSHSF